MARHEKRVAANSEEIRDYRLSLSKFRLGLIFRYGRSATEPNALYPLSNVLNGLNDDESNHKGSARS